MRSSNHQFRLLISSMILSTKHAIKETFRNKKNSQTTISWKCPHQKIVILHFWYLGFLKPTWTSIWGKGLIEASGEETNKKGNLTQRQIWGKWLRWILWPQSHLGNWNQSQTNPKVDRFVQFVCAYFYFN